MVFSENQCKDEKKTKQPKINRNIADLEVDNNVL
jgi:hypothetical protein